MKYRYVFGLFAVLTLLIVVLAACGGSTAPSGASRSQEVKVTLSEYSIQSSQTTFSPGTSYHFVVANNGKIPHEFMIMPMGMNMHGMSMDDMHKIALHMIDNVAPGETKTFDYPFASSMMGQNFEFACHLPGHYEAGMKLPMMVNR
jgi:uncharacterized cupredoxin-like copper-binding protein